MGQIKPIQNSFSAGELTPLLSARSDMELYHKGCEIMRNWFTKTQGPARTRGGSEKISSLPGDYGNIFPFYISSFVGYIVTVTPTKVYVADQGGSVVLGDELTNGDFIDGSLGWTDMSVGAGQAVFAGGVCQLNPGELVEHIASISQQTDVLTVDQPYQVKIVISSGEGPMVVSLGTSAGGAQISQEIYVGSQTVYVDIPAGYPQPWVTVSIPGGEETKWIDRISVYDISDIGVVEFDSPWTSVTDIGGIQIDMPAGEDSMYMVSPGVAPQVLSLNKIERLWSLEEIVFTEPPADWTGTNWPRAITFFQGRLWLGGTETSPETFWGSVSDKYTDFTVGTEADSSIEYRLAKKGYIRWMGGVKNLLIGTGNSEFIVTSDTGLIVPGDVYAEQQSAYGSLGAQSEEFGSNVLYISPDGRKVREMAYTWEEQGWISQDLTYAAEHLTEGDQVLGISFAQNPYTIIWMNTARGNMVGCTYDKATNTIGWHKHETDGNVLDICVLENGGQSELWLLVSRGISGQVHLERINLDISLDSYYRQFAIVKTNLLQGATHLANRTVGVLADGALHPDITLDSNGNGILNWEANAIVVGLNFTSILLTMPLDEGQEGGRSGMGLKKRWSKLYVRMTDSANPKINGKRPAARTAPTPMNTREPSKTIDLEVSNLGYDKGQILIEQDLPFVTTVCGIYGDVSQS